MKSLENEIVVEEGQARFCFRTLEWDSGFFGVQSYYLDTGQSVLRSSKGIPKKLSSALSGTFVTAKLDISEERAVFEDLFAAGFQYIDTQITLQHVPGLSAVRERNDIVVKELKNPAVLPVEQLGSVYSLTRFHTDTHIANKKADELWCEYLRSYKSDLDHYILAGFCDDEAAGVVLANRHEDQVNMFFVSVLPEFQGKGIGSQLVRQSISRFQGSMVTVGTQARNVPALNFYMKAGFCRVKSMHTVLHRW